MRSHRADQPRIRQTSSNCKCKGRAELTALEVGSILITQAAIASTGQGVIPQLLARGALGHDHADSDGID